ncbi:MAG: hypothetical protein Kow0042_07060 [Calditrichia bacterium]
MIKTKKEITNRGQKLPYFFGLFWGVFSLIVIILSFNFAATAQDNPPDSLLTDTVRAAEPDSLPVFRDLNRIVPNEAFRVGEKLSFVVRYGFLHAGTALMEVKEVVPIRNRKAYRIVSTAQSNRTFDFIFKVRDRVESYLDTAGLFSWKFVKMLREGGYKFDLLVDYDQHYGKAYVQAIRYYDEEPLRVKKNEVLTVDIPPYVLDILSSFYYVRTQNLRIGDPIYLSNHDNKQVYDLKVLIQTREIVQVKAGKFRCIKVQPVLKGEAIFKQEGKLWVWLTDDQYKIPVQMKSAVFIGSITTELTKIEGVKLPLPSQIE